MIKIYILSIVMFMVILFSGCKSTEYIQVPVEKTKTEYITKKDSIYIHDSIDVYKEVKGDTVYINKFKYRIKEVLKKDTVLKTDTITKMVTINKEVEVNKLYFWQKGLMYLGGVGIILLLGILIHKFKLWKLLF